MHRSPTLRALAALLALVLGHVLAASAATADAADEEFAVVGMPFAGQWANSFATAPWQHPVSHGDWSMDLYATNTPVRAAFPAASGELTLLVVRVATPGCSPNAGDEVRVAVAVDGVYLGYTSYMHLTDVSVAEGDVIAEGSVLGRTVAVSENFGQGGCWQVRYPETGIHTHFEVDSTSGSACYVRYGKGDGLPYGSPLTQIGAGDPESCVSDTASIVLHDPDDVEAANVAFHGLGFTGPVINSTISAAELSARQVEGLYAVADDLDVDVTVLQAAGDHLASFLHAFSGDARSVDLRADPQQLRAILLAHFSDLN